MAEAAAVQSLYFCHQCRLEMSPLMPDYLCPQCESGFIEPAQSSQEPSGGPSAAAPMEQDNDFITNIFTFAGGALDENDGPAARIDLTDWSTSPLHNAQFFSQRLRRNRLRGSDRGAFIGPMLQELIFMGNPGDYVLNGRSFDNVITRLMNQLENPGPPPLNQDQIQTIPDNQITEEQVKNKLQCPVCMEDYKLEEKVKKLDCEHYYHEECIVPWLLKHATCPVCRKTPLVAGNPREDPEDRVISSALFNMDESDLE